MAAPQLAELANMASLATYIAVALAMVPMDQQQVTRSTSHIHQPDEMRKGHTFPQEQSDMDNPIKSTREVRVPTPLS